jgi:hypothetical protein
VSARLHSIAPVSVDSLTALDLRDEAATAAALDLSCDAYRALAAKADGTPEAEALEVLVVRHSGRIGIAWGGDAKWADIGDDETPGALVELFLADADAYEARS